MEHLPRRAMLTALTGLAGCSLLPDRPYQQKRVWPLGEVSEPPRQGPRGAPVLMVRATGAAPGLESRGLRERRADGSVTSDYWEEWAAPPAPAVEAALRARLAASGLFAAVTSPGSRLDAGRALESELLELLDDGTTATASIGWTLIDLTRDNTPILQRTSTGSAPLGNGSAPARAAAQNAALAAALDQIIATLRATRLAA